MASTTERKCWMITDYDLIDPEDEESQPTADIFLRKDGQGNVDIVINREVVAFFNPRGELWLVNFLTEDIAPLTRAGIKMVESGSEKEYYTLLIR